MLLEKIRLSKIEYEKNGVAKIPSVFTQDEVNKIRADAIMSLSRVDLHDRVRIQVKKRNGVDFPALSFWACLTSDYLNVIRTDSRLASIVREFLGDNVKQLNNQVYFRLPGDGDEFAWHQDKLFRVPEEDFPGIENSYLQTIVVIDEITETNGAVEYILGSHKDGDLQLIERNSEAPKKLRDFKRDNKNGVKILAKPGDVIVWSVMIVHGSEKNLSCSPRMTYMNGFAKAEASKNFPYYLKNGIVLEKINTELFP